MEEPTLYQQIAAAVRQEILDGQLKPGDRLPTVRQMTERWKCTPGTVQHAYRELASQGLVVSRAGQGTHVVEKPALQGDAALRRALLVHRAEAFLLETLTAGYDVADVEDAVRLALDRWRAVSQAPEPVRAEVLRFAGSHDPALAWIAAHLPEISGQAAPVTLQLNFCGSLGGLIALSEGRADLAGCHLWDAETDSYNLPFVRRLLPGKRTALLTLAHRRLGLLLAPGNPFGLADLSDLARPGLRFINRQPGSGTRVWLDAALQRTGQESTQISGYSQVVTTHSEAARQIAEGQADAAFGLQTAATAFGLDFIPLVRERYDLAIPEAGLDSLPAAPLVHWLQTPAARDAIARLGGYDTGATGQIEWA